MAAFSEADFKRSFDKILFGGQISPGIEVAADLGLESHKYIILPASLAIRTVWKYGPTEDEHKPELSQNDPCESQTDGVHTLPNGLKYVINPKAIYIRNQRYYCNNVDGLPTQGGDNFQEVWPVFAQSPPMSALQQFIRHNIGRVGSTDYEDIVNGLGLRWYGTIFGLVYCVFDGEFEETTNAINTAVEREDDIIKGIMEPKRARECLTLICARFLSWRRTNHATGGPTATGVVQRTGSAFGWFETTGSGANESLRRYTDLFHTNAHQSNCKVISSIFFGKHAEHWGVFCPKYGFTFPKEVQTSMRVRAENSSGVAGAAVITDAVAVLKNLILDQTFVCLQGTEAIPTLINQYNHVKANGLLCGVAQAWWVEHNPFGLTAQPLSEFTVSLQTLLGDIGAANDSYLNSKTLKNAKALESAYLKYGVSTRRDFWRQLGRVKKESGMKDIKTALSIMRKQVGIVGVECTSIIAEDISVRNEAINKVNSIMTSVSTALGLPAPKTLVVPSAQEIAAAISEVNAAEHERAAPQGPQPMDLA